jgi:hypothetical protein
MWGTKAIPNAAQNTLEERRLPNPKKLALDNLLASIFRSPGGGAPGSFFLFRLFFAEDFF